MKVTSKKPQRFEANLASEPNQANASADAVDKDTPPALEVVAQEWDTVPSAGDATDNRHPYLFYLYQIAYR